MKVRANSRRTALGSTLKVPLPWSFPEEATWSISTPAAEYYTN